MYKSIVAPVDGSKRVEGIVPEIEKVALCTQARLIVLRVCRAHVAPGRDPEAEVEGAQAAEEYWERITDELRAKGVEAEAHVPYGDAADEILSHSKRNECDVISLCTHGRSGLGRWLFWGA